MDSNLHWYYLHTNGSLIHKSFYGMEQRADFQESDFVKKYWLIDISNRESAWNLLLEALDAGAAEDRIRGLGILWGCDETDLVEYMARSENTPQRIKMVHNYITKMFKKDANKFIESIPEMMKNKVGN